MGVEGRQRKGAQNQALMRDVNERVVELAREQVAPGERFDLICECFDTACVETISLTIEEYEEIRASPVRFAVKRGHILQEVERVVEERERYAVVEKFGAGGELAVQHRRSA